MQMDMHDLTAAPFDCAKMHTVYLVEFLVVISLCAQRLHVLYY